MKPFLLTLATVFIIAALSLFFLKHDIYYQGEVSDHFNGTRFFNPNNVKNQSLWNVIYWRLFGDHAQWPITIIPSNPHTLVQPAEDEIIVTFINHASCLIQTQNITILTDPHYTNHASPVTWAGPYRVHEPGIAYDKLPPIDVVIISHDHYDHMDKETLQMLERDHNPIFLLGLGNDVHLRSFGITDKVQTLDWWEPLTVGDSKIIFVPAQHFSGRGLFDTNAALWGGFIIQSDKVNLFFAGDTGYGPHFKDIQTRIGDIDLAMLPIGSYLPRWFMKNMHINPEEAVLAHLDLKSKKSIGIHFKTFQMSDESYEAPAIDLEKAKKKYNIQDQAFIAPEFGQSFILKK